MNIRTQIQKRANLLKANDAILKKAERENRSALTPDEKATYDANMVEIREIGNQIERHSLNAEAARHNSTAVPIASVDFEDFGKPRFKSLGEQLCAVARYEQSRGASQDPRLIAVGSEEHRKLQAAATGMNEAVPAEGGFLVQTDFAEGLLQKTYDSGELMGLCNNLEVSSPSNRLVINAIDEQSRANGSRFGGVQAFWANEADSITATKPKFRRIELILNKLTGLTFATDELLQDGAALQSVIENVFPMEFAFRIEDAIINGLGNGQPLGILNHPALIVVPKEAGQAANTVQSLNIMKMWSRCWGRSRKQAVWLYDQSIEPQLFAMTLPNAGVATPIYLPPSGLASAPYGTLFGRPIFPTEYNAALSSQGDIILADFSQYTLARKSVLQAASSMHVNFLKDETAFRFTLRLDGQPQWNTALTPKSNSGTLSPFVTLQAR